MGHIKRIFTCCVVDSSDQFAYLGTKTGDIIEVSLERALFKRIGPVKRLFSQGINCINLLANGDLLVGAGDGTVSKISFKDLIYFLFKKFILLLVKYIRYNPKEFLTAIHSGEQKINAGFDKKIW